MKGNVALILMAKKMFGQRNGIEGALGMFSSLSGATPSLA